MLNEIARNIYKLSLPLPYSLGQVNSYLFKGEHGYTIVDTGGYSQETIEVWEEIIESGIAIEKVVLTHTHPDHCGLAGWFQKNHKVPIFLSDLSTKELKKMQYLEENKNPLNSLFKKHEGPILPNMTIPKENFDFSPDVMFRNGEHIEFGNETYEVILTSGHSKDHFCFYNKKHKVMILGDHVLAEVSPMIEISGDKGENPLGDYFESLQLIKKYPIKLALTGHGELILNLKDRIQDILSRHQYRLNQVLQIVKEKDKSAGQINEEMYGKEIGKFYVEKFMAILTRLIYLESIGKLMSYEEKGKIYFRILS